MAEVHDEIQEKSRKIRNFVVLPPAAGDRGDPESDLEDAVKDCEDEYAPAGELEIEESDSDIEQPDNSPPRKRKLLATYRPNINLKMVMGPLGTCSKCICCSGMKNSLQNKSTKAFPS